MNTLYTANCILQLLCVPNKCICVYIYVYIYIQEFLLYLQQSK